MGYYDSKTLGRFPARTKTYSRPYSGSTDEPAADPTPLLFFMDSKGRIQATKSGFETASWGGSGNYSFSITSPYSDVPINSYPAGYAYASIVSVWASRCIEIRSESVARIKREVVDRRTKKPVPNHPLSVALRRAQEHGENIYALWEHCKLVFGEVFLWPIKNDYQNAGLVTGHSDLAWLNNLGMNVLTIGGKIGGFTYAPVSGGRVRQFEPHQLAFYKTLNLFNNLRGLSPLDSILLELGIDKDVSRVTKAWYANDARPGLVLVPEVDVGVEAGKEFMQYWKDNFQGARNAGKPVIMPSVIKDIKELNRAPSPDDVEIRESMRREICARFGVPLSIAGAWDDATYQSAPEQRKSLYEETIIPECEDLDKWFTVTVLPYFDDSGQCEVKTDLTDVKALIEDEGVKGAISNQRFLAGGTSFNEYRHELGKPPVPDDFFVRPQGYSIVPYADVGKPTPPTPETSAPPAFGGSGLIAPHPDASPVQQPFAPKPSTPNSGTTTGRAKSTDISAEDELAAWRKKAMNGGSIKALTFVCYALPKDIESHIRAHLKPNMDKVALKAVFDEALLQVKKKTTLDGAITITPEQAAEYWDDFDILYAQLGADWLNDYMRRAFEAIKPKLRGSIAPDEIMHLLSTFRDDLVSQWIGTEDEPGVITQLTVAGMAAGNHALEKGKSDNPVKAEAGVTVDWSLLNKQAYEFAQSYVYNLIRGLDDTTRADVQNAISRWIQTGDPLAVLESELEKIFNDAARAANIAQTESTRVYNEGAKQRWSQVGVKRARWQTVRDVHVCPICEELNGQEYDLSQGAWSEVLGKYIEQPAHPRCRCFARPLPPALEDIPEEVKPKPATQPRGESVSSSLSFEAKGLTQKLKAKLQEALNAIDSVHGTKKLPNIAIKGSSGRIHVGGYAYDTRGNATEIKVSTKSEAPLYTLSHEIGHFIDHKGFDENTKFVFPSDKAKSGEGVLADWFKAIEQTPEYQQLRDMYTNPSKYVIDDEGYKIRPDLQYIRYLLSPKEIWARSYAQYIAEKTGNQALLDDLQTARAVGGKVDWYTNSQWSSDNFAPVLQAIDDVFKAMGWIE